MTRDGPGEDPTAAPALAARLAAMFGPDVDPGISLEQAGEADAPSDFSSEVLRRLASRPDASSRYRLQGEVGSGGMGAVLAVWDEDLRRHLAMKVILGKVATTDGQGKAPAGAPADASDTPPVHPKTVGRFLEEAQVTGQLDHPGIVPVHELGLDRDGRVFFTMKLVKGEDLKAVFARVHAGEESWSVTRVLGLIQRACEAMAYAHAKGVIHRDLKPANIMVGNFGEVYVMDWGLARVLGGADGKDIRLRPEGVPATMELHSERHERATRRSDSPLVTMDGDIVGTPAYMPPEQARGKLERLGPASDVYAVGAMLYHLLAGQMPYVTPGASAGARTILRLVQHGSPRPLHELAPDAPAELVAICERAMEREPERRYADMSALAEDLRAYLEHRVVSAYETGAVAELKKWVLRNKGLAASLGGLFVLLLAGGSMFAWLSGELADQKAALQETNIELAATNTALDTSLADARAQRKRADREAETATANAERADANAATAQANATRAEREKANVLRLSAFQELEDLGAEADALWPAMPELLDDYFDWLARADALVKGLDPSADGEDIGHRQQLESLRARALPRTEEQRQVERVSHPSYTAWAGKRDEIETAEAQLTRSRAKIEKAGLTGEEAAKANGILAQAGARLARERQALAVLDAEIDVRRSYGFADERDTWWQNQLVKLIGQIEAFGDPQAGLIEGISDEFGWGVARRRAFAATVEERTLTGADAMRRWAEAVASIANRESCPLYAGLELSPQRGLLPIGRDPDSGLWEFWHVMSGDEPLRRENGKLVLTEASGIVLVLIPGGTFWMGAQASDPEGRNYDPVAQSDEGPVHEVSLSPYLLSKYEMTQGQWQVIADINPSQYGPGMSFENHTTTLVHPVEQVSWNDTMVVLPRLGLQLPTEAQWERAARGGTASAWWTGNERDSLKDPPAANLADQAAQRVGAPWTDIKDWPELDDGWAAHAPVDGLRPNPFGLHHVHGNVWEWCLDGYDDDYYARSSAEDPLNDPSGSRNRSIRGGSYSGPASFARSASRFINSPDFHNGPLGLRPARGVTP